MSINRRLVRTALAIQWLRLCTSNAGGPGSVPDWGTKILQAVRMAKKKKKKPKTKKQKKQTKKPRDLVG